MTRRLVECIQRKSISTRRTFVSIAEEVGLDPRSIRNVFREAAYFAWIDTIPAELYPTYTPLMLTIEEWGDAIFAHFDHDRITGAFVAGANGLSRVLSRMRRGYGLKALRDRLLYGLREGRGRKQVPTKESRNGDGVDGPFLGVPLSTLLPQDLSGNGDAPSTLASR